jgi:putative iron-only hydrogenase system regulator
MQKYDIFGISKEQTKKNVSLQPQNQAAPQVNAVLSRHAGIIICRQGFPRGNYSIISVIFEGTTDEIGSLTGQLGRIEGIEVKSALLKGHETT